MSQKTNITVNLQASNLGEAVGITEAEFNELQVVINEAIDQEVKRSHAEENTKGINLLNIINSFNERLNVPQLLLVSAFFASEVLKRHDRSNSPIEQLLEAMRASADADKEDGDETPVISLTQEQLENPDARA